MAENGDDFHRRLDGMMSAAYAGFVVSLGHDVGLFDSLAKGGEEPRTSQEIADVGNFKERYVRELLNALVMARIVELDPSGEKYFLPKHRVNALTHSDATPTNVLSGLLILQFGGVYRKIKECFKLDGPRGVPYEEYDGAMDIFNRYTEPFLKKCLVTKLVCPYPELKRKLEEGIAVLDLGCGHGVSTIEFGKAFPKSPICGIDLLERSLMKARTKALDLENVSFIAQDVAQLPEDWNQKYGLVFMHDMLHDQARPDRVLSETYRVLAPGGIALIVDELSHSKVKDNLERMDLPSMLEKYTVSLMHCMPVSLSFEGGMGLGTCWGREKAVEMITTAGLEVLKVDEIPELMFVAYYCKKQ